jgi:hypothetical protein
MVLKMQRGTWDLEGDPGRRGRGTSTVPKPKTI